MKENSIKKNKIIAWILIPLMVIIAFAGGYFIRYLVEGKNVRLATELIRIMEKVGYVYDEKTNELRAITPEGVGDALVNGILDDYAEFYTEEEYNQSQKERAGKYQGIGISFFNSDNVIDSVVGKSGITVNLEIERNGVVQNVSIVAENYIASYVEYSDNEVHAYFEADIEGAKPVRKESISQMSWLDAQTAYVSLASFNGSAFSQIKQVLSLMKERGRTKLVFDLRNNGGGYMDILVEIASLFIDNGGKNSVITYEQNKKETTAYRTSSNLWGDFINSMSIVANGRTASASECFIGALASYNEIFNLDRLIIDKSNNGKETTYGKGIMQTTYLLVNGGALKLTTAKVLWPNKERTCIHGKGISTISQNVVEGEMVLQRAVEVLN